MRIPKNRFGKLLGVMLVLLVIVFNMFILLNPDVGLSGKTVYKARTGQRSYAFNGTISREVLESYLSRSITVTDLLKRNWLEASWVKGNVNDSIRCITNISAKYIGRTIFTWNQEKSLFANINDSKKIAEKIHGIDPEIILQGCFFEAVSTQVNSIPIPGWVFEEFGLSPESRNFSYNSMFDTNWHYVNYWEKTSKENSSVPDISKLETKMWAFFLSATFINIGIEAMHFGNINQMSSNDHQHLHLLDILQHVRAYAKIHARRHMVLCDAHVSISSREYMNGYNLMFDFHAFPLRPEEVASEPEKAILVVGHSDSIYKRSQGGVAPSGWTCDSLPYLVEFDNFGASGHPGEPIGGDWTWGYDEITWYAVQPEQYRNNWLWYAVRWLEQSDPNGFLEMPGSRPISVAINGGHQYFANTAGVNMTNGFNQEATIKSIWEQIPNFYLT